MYSIRDFRFGKSSDFLRNTIYSSKLELSLSARNLVNRDIGSKSDPQCFVYMRQGFTDRYIEIGRTEVINNDLNPDWAKKLNIDYKFNESQQIKFEIWNIDRIAGNKFLGQVIVELAKILVSKGTHRQNLNSEELNANSFGGDILIRAEELSSNKQIVLMQFSASRLLEKHTYGTTDSYLVISKANSDGTFSVVHKTEVAKNAVKPKWKPFRISLQQLCSGDYERTLKFECFDFDKSSGHDSIGFSTTNLRKLITRPSHLNKYEV
jgi:Ca2+-dependent lipid-binding protein